MITPDCTSTALAVVTGAIAITLLANTTHSTAESICVPLFFFIATHTTPPTAIRTTNNSTAFDVEPVPTTPLSADVAVAVAVVALAFGLVAVAFVADVGFVAGFVGFVADVGFVAG